MNSSNNLKSGQKALSMQMLILAVVIILIAAIGLFIQKSAINNSGFKDYQRTSKLSRDINSVHSNLYRIKGMVASSQDKQEIAKLSDQQAAVITEDINLVKKTLETDISAEQKKYYQALLENLVEYQKSSLQVIRLAPLGTGGAYLSSANEKMEATNQILTQLLDYESNGGGGSSGMAFYIVIIALIAMLVLSFVLIPSFIKKMLAGAVIEPLQETASVLREFANGKYNRALIWEADDAIGELVQSVNSLRSKMSSPAAGSAQKTLTPEAAPAPKAPTPETVTAPVDERSKSLSDMIKKTPEQTRDVDKLVTSSRKAIDKLQDI